MFSIQQVLMALEFARKTELFSFYTYIWPKRTKPKPTFHLIQSQGYKER